MKTIEIPYRQDDPKSVAVAEVPQALLNAVHDTLARYPEVMVDDPINKPLDRMFERLYNCKVEYRDEWSAVRVVWDNDADYTWFMLRWT